LFWQKPQGLIDFADLASNFFGTPSGLVTPTPSLGSILTSGELVFCLTDFPCATVGVLSLGIGAGFAAIAEDPIDSNYQVISTPDPGPRITVDPSAVPGLSSEQDAALTDMVSALNDVYGLPGAIQDAFNRAEGAFQTGDPLWEALQLYAMAEYAVMAKSDFERIVADARILGVDLSTPAPASVLEPGTLTLFGTACLLAFLWARFRRQLYCPSS
jgi:hypothetical protein